MSNIFAKIDIFMGLFGLFSNKKKETLDKGLEKTKESVFSKLARAVAGKSTVDDDVLDDLEEVLITSDVGVETTVKIIHRIEDRVARDKYVSTSELNKILREEIANLLSENHSNDNEDWDLPADHKPQVTGVQTCALPICDFGGRCQWCGQDHHDWQVGIPV